jgi:hypothetical protein
VASTHSGFFQGQMDMVLFFCSNHSEKTWLSKEEEEGHGLDLSDSLKTAMA